MGGGPPNVGGADVGGCTKMEGMIVEGGMSKGVVSLDVEGTTGGAVLDVGKENSSAVGAMGGGFVLSGTEGTLEGSGSKNLNWSKEYVAWIPSARVKGLSVGWLLEGSRSLACRPGGCRM